MPVDEQTAIELLAESSGRFGWQPWFFQQAGPVYPVRVLHWLPIKRTNEAGEVIGEQHWFLRNGTVYVSPAGHAELKRLGDATR